ncbi:endonuclease domain-containing protein [Streptomyces sp. NPDC058548]|uniref:endonuclease domain-containing protein n=1 Tax=Streptomyces sp. NPDC058548 TaxID=3346545 RepID=UPI00364E4F01
MINDLSLGPLSHAPMALADLARYVDYGHSKRSDVPCTHKYEHRLTCDEYDAMRDRAQGECELCDTPDHETPRGQLVIDHFRGRRFRIIRGLICDRCNSVMSRHDATAPWGPASLPFAERARAYHLNAFSRPTVELLQRADAEIELRRARLAARRV